MSKRTSASGRTPDSLYQTAPSSTATLRKNFSIKPSNNNGNGTNPTPNGRYTRYGDVLPLLESPDDQFVIMGAGDEVKMRFAASALPPPAKGFRRDFLLKVDGWAKDRDANTAYSQSTDPLPFHAMSRYPYPESEHYPDTPVARAYRTQYNTRPALRLIRPLVKASN